MRFFICFGTFFFGATLLAMEEIDVSQPLRIEELMPRKGQVTFIAIEPAIPRNYIALSKTGEISYFSDWVYWGPEDVLKSYFKDKATLSTPILLIDFTPNYSQREKGILDVGSIKNAVGSDLMNSKIESGTWGEYPYCTISGQFNGEDINMAYVGLNNENGAILFFNLIIPNIPDGKAIALKFWSDFFKNTKQLPEPLYLRVIGGQELHPGYTIVDVVGRKIKVVAERRKSDRKTQFAFFSEDGTVTFQYKNAIMTPMPCEWHFFEPVVKIEGTFVVDKGWVHYHMFTTVLIKEVEAFTPISKEKESIFVKELS